MSRALLVAAAVVFTAANAVVYFDHPHGRGLNLLAICWGVVGLLAVLVGRWLRR